jgi:hypothetical protein
MRYLWPLGIGFGFGFATVIHGCSEVVPGSCYPDPAGGAGGAGSMAVGVGVGVGASSGDFISPPQNGPLDYGGGSNPCIMPQSPCSQKCEAESETRALECPKIADVAQRGKCQENNYWQYKSCRQNCQQTDKDKTCTDMYVACRDKGKPCTRQIDPGMTLCAYCRDDCQAKRPYKYSECYKCGFE